MFLNNILVTDVKKMTALLTLSVECSAKTKMKESNATFKLYTSTKYVQGDETMTPSA